MSISGVIINADESASPEIVNLELIGSWEIANESYLAVLGTDYVEPAGCRSWMRLTRILHKFKICAPVGAFQENPFGQWACSSTTKTYSISTTILIVKQTKKGLCSIESEELKKIQELYELWRSCRHNNDKSLNGTQKVSPPHPT
jgi:hypothetical protein